MTSDESGQVPDENVGKLAFVVGDNQQVDMMFSIAGLGSAERENFAIFTNENVDADG